MAPMYMGQMSTWYPNSLFNPMFIGMPQLGTQMALMLIPQYTMPSTMVTSMGITSQNPMYISVVATTTERTQPIETSLVFPNMTKGMPQSNTPGHTVESSTTFRQ